VADGPLISFADGVWVDTGPVRFLGLQLTATMAVLRLGDSSLLLYAPLAMTPERRAAVEGLGRVAHLYVPNLFHHLWIGEWAAAFPSARLHAPARLAKKRRDLRIDRPHDAAPDPAFAGVVDELRIDGFRLDESVLFYRPARTLVVADLVHNIGQPQHPWTTFYTQTMGFYDRVALSRMIRWTAFSDRAIARRSLDELLARPFDRLVLGHVAPLRDAGLEVTSCAVVAKDGAMPASLEQITAAHPRIHTAEGCFYRDALLAAAQALGLVARVLPPKELESAAATVMGLGRAQVPGLLTDAGRIVGRPWGKDQKMAALAAWIMLGAL